MITIFTYLLMNFSILLGQSSDRVFKQITIRSTSRICIAPDSKARFHAPNAYLKKGMKLVEINRIDTFYAEIAKTENLKKYFKNKLSTDFEELVNKRWYFYDKGGRYSPDGFDSDPQYFIHNWLNDQTILISENQIELGILPEISKSLWDMLVYDVQHYRINLKCNILLAGKGRIYEDIPPKLGNRKIILQTPNLGRTLREHPGRITLSWYGKGISAESVYYIDESHIKQFTEPADSSQEILGFMITEETIQSLEGEKIPPGLLKKLQSLKGEKFDDRDSFFQALENIIGTRGAKKYARIIAQYAIIYPDENIGEQQNSKTNISLVLIIIILLPLVVVIFRAILLKRRRQKNQENKSVYNATKSDTGNTISSSSRMNEVYKEGFQKKYEENYGKGALDYDKSQVQTLSEEIYNIIEKIYNEVEKPIPQSEREEQVDKKDDTPEKLVEKSKKRLTLLAQYIDKLKKENKYYKYEFNKLFNFNNAKQLDNLIQQMENTLVGIEAVLRNALKNQYNSSLKNTFAPRLNAIRDNLEKLVSISSIHTKDITPNGSQGVSQQKSLSHLSVESSESVSSSKAEIPPLIDNDLQPKKGSIKDRNILITEKNLNEIKATHSPLFVEIYQNAFALINSQNDIERKVSRRIIEQLESLKTEWKFKKDEVRESDVAMALMEALAPLWYSIEEKSAFQKIFNEKKWNIVHLGQSLNEKKLSELDPSDINKIRLFIQNLKKQGMTLPDKKRIVLEPTMEWKAGDSIKKPRYIGKYIILSRKEMEEVITDMK